MIGSGQDVLIQSARRPVVLWLLCRHVPAFAILLLPPTIVALMTDDWRLALALLPGIAIVGITPWLARPLAVPRDVRRLEGLIISGIAFALACLLVTPGFMTSGLGPVDGVFEAMSAVTTTGLSVHPDIAGVSTAQLFLRHWTQWCSGLAVLVLAIAFVGNASTAIGTRLGSIALDNRNRLASTQQRARRMLLIYSAVTVVTWFFLWLSGQPAFTALLLTLATVSTAGFAPTAESLAGLPALAITVTLAAAVLCAVSFDQIGFFRFRHIREFWRRIDILPLFAAIALATTLIALFEWLAGRADMLATLGHALALASSAQSTAGFSTMNVSELSSGSVLTLTAAMVVGGDVGSTAGGIKIMRLMILFAVVRAFLMQARSSDHAVIHVRQGNRRIKDRDLAATIGIVFVYMLFCAFGLGIFVAAGHPPLYALFDVVSALSTAGLSTGLVGPELESHLKITLTLLMWLGRVEFLAVILLCLPRTWRS